MTNVKCHMTVGGVLKLLRRLGRALGAQSKVVLAGEELSNQTLKPCRRFSLNHEMHPLHSDVLRLFVGCGYL